MKTTDTKAVLLLLAVCALVSSAALRALAAGSTLAVLESFPVHITDRSEAPEARAVRLAEIASAIDAATTDPTERAALLTLVRYESAAAAYVFEGRCADGPRGLYECDGTPGKGHRAHGVYQLHVNSDHPVIPADVATQSRIALRLWKSGRVRCRSSVPDELAGAFMAYGSGGKCAPAAWSQKRADHVRRVRGKL